MCQYVCSLFDVMFCFACAGERCDNFKCAHETNATNQTDECKNVKCTVTVDMCSAGAWPFCYDQTLTKVDPYDCCPQCLDPYVCLFA